MGRMTSHILWKIKNVPNHQPVMGYEYGIMYWDINNLHGICTGTLPIGLLISINFHVRQRNVILYWGINGI
jgi:hypothetical protein